MHHKNAVSRNLDHVARHCDDCCGGSGPAVDFDRDFCRVVFQAGINGICGEHVAAAAVDSHDDFRHAPQRVQLFRKLQGRYFVPPPCFGSNVAVKNQFRGRAFLCRRPEVPEMFISLLAPRRACRVRRIRRRILRRAVLFLVFLLHPVLPPLTFFPPV